MRLVVYCSRQLDTGVLLNGRHETNQVKKPRRLDNRLRSFMAPVSELLIRFGLGKQERGETLVSVPQFTSTPD